MLETRIDPVKNQKVAYATGRQGRTFHPPKDYCPLCPTKPGGIATEIPEDDYDIVVFENRFPTFSNDAEWVDDMSDIYKRLPSKGICEVICYSSSHDSYLEDQPLERIENLIYVWMDRYQKLGKIDFIDYVFIFENKGKEIGVTLSHPHGQIYAFSYIPPIPASELSSSKDYFDSEGQCLHCQILGSEIRYEKRVIYKNDDFVSFIPYYARWPYEAHVYPLRHIESIDGLCGKEVGSLAKALKDLILRYNGIFDTRMPYVMVLHQSPTDEGKYPHYHFHFEFYPPYRTADKLKYMAGCELGAGTFINDTMPEEKAEELRKVKI